MFGKSKPTVNVQEAVTAVMKYAEQDEMFKAVLTGIMAQDVVRMKAMANAWVIELKKKGSSPEVIAAVSSLSNLDVARAVRTLVRK